MDKSAAREGGVFNLFPLVALAALFVMIFFGDDPIRFLFLTKRERL